MSRRVRFTRSKVRVIDHPLVKEGMTVLRNKRTDVMTFRETLRRMARFIATEALAAVPPHRMRVQTPLAGTNGWTIRTEVTLVPVLRAGLGLVEGFLDIWPAAHVGHVGLYRDEKTLEPVEYYRNLPRRVNKGFVVVLDPMLATGGSAVATLDLLRSDGVRAPILATLISAPEGIARVQKEFPDVHIVTCAIDSHLNSSGYIVPGLGDAGDRLYGT